MEGMEDNKESHSNTKKWMQKMDNTLTIIDGRVSNVETSLRNNAPTIEEFIQIKHKVIGAGTVGRWLWVGLSTVLGLLISMKEQIFRLFSN